MVILPSFSLELCLAMNAHLQSPKFHWIKLTEVLNEEDILFNPAQYIVRKSLFGGTIGRLILGNGVQLAAASSLGPNAKG